MPIEQLRNMLLIGLILVGFLIWQAWQQDYGATRVVSSPASSTESPADVPSSPVAAAGGSDQAAPAADVPSAPGQGGQETALSSSPAANLVRVSTDLLEVAIDPSGGTVRELSLKAYPASNEHKDEPFTLLTDKVPDVFLMQSGLVGNENAPSHRAQYQPKQLSYELADGQDELVVPLQWRSTDGVEVTKRLILKRGSYVIRVEHEVKNSSEDPWSARMYGQLQRAEVPSEGGLFRTYTYTGGVVSYDEKPYQKVDFDDMATQDLAETHRGGWIAMIQHYFAAAVVPPPEGDNYYYTKALGGARYVAGVMGPAQTVAPGSSATLIMDMYAGPKDQDRMQAVAPYLERTVDYGWLWFIAEPLFFALRWIHGFVGNWGFSIILLTIVVKLLFFHLSATSYKSMARMRKLQPRIIQLRERYGSDKARMNQAMMELYKTEKINPLGGCLPIIVQIPVFISLYWVLLESVELR